MGIKYKNITNGINKFRAFDLKGNKVKFEVKAGGTVELGREIKNPKAWGLEEIEKTKKKGGK